MFQWKNLTPQLTKFKRTSFLINVRRSSYHEEEISQEERIRAKIGNREIVGFGLNGEPNYIDLHYCPFPSIRFREIGPQLTALREKEKGDWRTLTIDEKKCLYRTSFCNTFAEMDAPDPEMKSVIGWTLIWVSAGLWLYIFYQLYIRLQAPKSFSPESRIAQYNRMVDLNVSPISGIPVPRGAVKRVHPKNQKMLDELNAQLNSNSTK